MAIGQKSAAIISTGVFCFAAGAATGIAWMMFAGYKFKRVDPMQQLQLSQPPMPMSRVLRLHLLISTLDRLTGEPLTLRLSDEQKKKIAAEIEDVDETTNEMDATNKVNAILRILKNERDTLEDAGFRNPMMDPAMAMPHSHMGTKQFDENVRHLKSLRQRLATK